MSSGVNVCVSFKSCCLQLFSNQVDDQLRIDLIWNSLPRSQSTFLETNQNTFQIWDLDNSFGLSTVM